MGVEDGKGRRKELFGDEKGVVVLGLFFFFYIKVLLCFGEKEFYLEPRDIEN